MDETVLSLPPPLRACWMKRGQQKRIPTPGIQQRLHLFGAYRFEKDTLVWKAARRKNSQALIEFLEPLFVECHPSGHFILTLDKASIHQSDASLAALSLFEHRVSVIWLPAYCSELNP
ncbi:MAG: transposase, partial [Anaerolineales bacterium]|nr:transposase [Anaerolineales bacterium]MDW8163096.1 transposase [Anaerolineales bacterium]